MTWDLDDLPAGTVDPMDAVLRRRAGLELAASNGRAMAEPPDDVPLVPLYPGLIMPIEAYRATVPDSIPWIAQPLVYAGGVTLLAGPPKAGKSTFASNLQRCRETGGQLLGSWNVLAGPTLLVTEEGGVAVVYKTTGLTRLDVMDRRAALQAELGFAQMLDAVGGWATEHSGGLAFIDTLAIWAGIKNENDASEMNDAVAKVTALAQATDLAIVIVHHSRKSGGDNGEGIRGSGAILATVDISVELSRVSPTSDDRWLDVQGRVILPGHYLLTFDRSAMAYALGDTSAAKLEAIEKDLTDIPADGPGLTRQEIGKLWGKNPRNRIEQLLDFGRLRGEEVKTGRTYAWHYWSKPAEWTPRLVLDEESPA